LLIFTFLTQQIILFIYNSSKIPFSVTRLDFINESLQIHLHQFLEYIKCILAALVALAILVSLVEGLIVRLFLATKMDPDERMVIV
jgi:hypothetical protein